MRVDELPPEIRKQLTRGAVDVKPPARSRPMPAQRRTWSGGGLFTCARCGERFPNYRPAERHIDKRHGYGRIDWTDR